MAPAAARHGRASGAREGQGDPGACARSRRRRPRGRARCAGGDAARRARDAVAEQRIGENAGVAEVDQDRGMAEEPDAPDPATLVSILTRRSDHSHPPSRPSGDVIITDHRSGAGLEPGTTGARISRPACLHSTARSIRPGGAAGNAVVGAAIEDGLENPQALDLEARVPVEREQFFALMASFASSVTVITSKGQDGVCAG